MRLLLPSRSAILVSAVFCGLVFTLFSIAATSDCQAADGKNAPAKASPYQSDSFVAEVQGKKTGFFHVERPADVWWVIDPLGRGFTPLGVDHVNYHAHWCQDLGYAPYAKKNKAKYGVDAWANESVGRLKSWGFNLLGAGCIPETYHRGMAHTVFASFGDSFAHRGDAFNILPGNVPCSVFPNVFHPDFEKYCQERAKKLCTPNVNDPWLFGYFLDNELAWFGKRWDSKVGLFEIVVGKPASHTAKQALRDFFAKRYHNDIAAFNRVWNERFASFDDLLKAEKLTAREEGDVLADKKAFIAIVGDRYFETITKAIRRADPNHMILGCRFADGNASDEIWQTAGRHCDIVSFNYYGNVDLDHNLARDSRSPRHGKPLHEVFQRFYEVGQRPMIVTEWSFPALDAGLPSAHGAGQRFRTQAERTRATEITARTMVSLPFLVGYDYFMWVDEPALGISHEFPEDSNYGLVNEDGKPYELLTGMFTKLHQEASRLHQEGLSKAGVATTAPANPESAIARFLTEMQNLKAENQQAAPSLKFERHGADFVASNGVMEISGKIGGPSLVQQIRHRGLVVGKFDGMVQQFAGQNAWASVNRLTDARAVVGAKAMAVDLTGRFNAPTSNVVRPFEISYRFVFLPNSDWFAVEWLSCKNLGDKPMDLRGVYFALHGQIGGSAADNAPTKSGVPNLWGGVNGGLWANEELKAYVGCAADDNDPIKTYFWLGKQGEQHPDSRFELEETIAPQATYRPASPTGVICVAGRGGDPEWQLEARKSLNQLRNSGK
jgi:hypothetical protein